MSANTNLRDDASLSSGERDWCDVYWGSHGCDLPRGHEKIGLPHVCLSCFDPDDMEGYVGAPPYYGPDTYFYGEDASDEPQGSSPKGSAS